jgi:hypothetical protein
MEVTRPSVTHVSSGALFGVADAGGANAKKLMTAKSTTKGYIGFNHTWRPV